MEQQVLRSVAGLRRRWHLVPPLDHRYGSGEPFDVVSFEFVGLCKRTP